MAATAVALAPVVAKIFGVEGNLVDQIGKIVKNFDFTKVSMRSVTIQQLY